MPEGSTTEKSKKRPFANLAKVLVGAGLPALGTAVLGPMGGAIGGAVAKGLGLAADEDADVVAETLADTNPSALVELRKIEADLVAAQLAAVTSEGTELTARLEADLRSDSWMAKNARPLVLLVMISGYLLFVYVATFILIGEQAANAITFGEQLQALLFTIVGFYFGSRGVEKVMSFKEGGRI